MPAALFDGSCHAACLQLLASYAAKVGPQLASAVELYEHVLLQQCKVGSRRWPGLVPDCMLPDAVSLVPCQALPVIPLRPVRHLPMTHELAYESQTLSLCSQRMAG